MSRRLLAALCVAAALTSPNAAHADDGSSSPPPDEAPVLHIVNGRRVWVIPPTRVHGQRQAPYVFTLPGRGPLGYTPDQETHSDAARVVEAVRHAPF